MGYKHTPRHWYQRTLEEEVERFMAHKRGDELCERLPLLASLGLDKTELGPPTFLGEDFVVDRPRTIPIDQSGEMIGWYADERRGSPILVFDEAGKPWRQVLSTAALQIGTEILVLTLSGDYAKAIVRSETEAESEGSFWILERETDVWVCTGGISKRAIKRLELAPLLELVKKGDP